MRFITLISDWQNDDFYTAAIKGRLYSHSANIQVVDITHKIHPFRYEQTAFLLRNVFEHFPEGTIHIVAVNSTPQSTKKPICLKVKGHYFLGTGIDIFSLIFTEKPDVIVEIKEQDDLKYSTFTELTMFAKSASILASGGNVFDLGDEVNYEQSHLNFLPAYDDNIIYGKVIYIDSYKNLFTNINKTIFEQIAKNRNPIIDVKRDEYRISKISNNYNDVQAGDFVALFNSINLLEIAQCNGQIAKILNIKLGYPVNVKF